MGASGCPYRTHSSDTRVRHPLPDGCVAVSRYGTQCSLYYTDRPNGATLQLAGSTADATGLYLGSCEEVQAARQS